MRLYREYRELNEFRENSIAKLPNFSKKANGQWLMANSLIYIECIRAVSLYALAEHCALNLFVERDCLARIFVKQD